MSQTACTHRRRPQPSAQARAAVEALPLRWALGAEAQASTHLLPVAQTFQKGKQFQGHTTSLKTFSKYILFFPICILLNLQSRHWLSVQK